MATPPMPTGAAPTQNGVDLDQFNAALRASPGWRDFMTKNGQPTDGRPIRLSGAQREAFRRQLQSAGVQFPDHLQIDPAGNVNQDQGVSRIARNRWVQIGLATAGALATMGAAGFGPLAGVMGNGAAAAGATSAAAGTGAATAAGAGAGLGTAATVATGAGIGSQLLRYGLQYGLPTVTGLIGARQAANADRDASQIEDRHFEEALAVEKEKESYRRGQFADYQSRLSPYGDQGRAAVDRAGGLLTGVPPSGPGMVQLKDSRGIVRAVPEAQAAQFIAQGAQRV